MSEIDDEVVALDLDRNRFGDIRPLRDGGARLDIHWVRLHAEAARIAIALAGADVELPAVPGAAQDFARPRVFDLAGIFGLRKTNQWPLAEIGALMRTAVQQAEKFALDVEDRDRSAVELDEFARARRQLIDRGNDVSSHQATPSKLGSGHGRGSPLPWGEVN
jgi:hypothetical protein